MQFLYGLLTGAGFFVALFYVYKLGQQSKRPAAKETNEEERKKAEKMRQGFEQLMSYDVTTALKGKKVSE
jgi:gas vesicle protein